MIDYTYAGGNIVKSIGYEVCINLLKTSITVGDKPFDVMIAAVNSRD